MSGEYDGPGFRGIPSAEASPVSTSLDLVLEELSAGCREIPFTAVASSRDTMRSPADFGTNLRGLAKPTSIGGIGGGGGGGGRTCASSVAAAEAWAAAAVTKATLRMAISLSTRASCWMVEAVATPAASSWLDSRRSFVDRGI